MIVDSSAITAIVRDEPDAQRYALALALAPKTEMSVANWLETAIVIDAERDPVASRRLDQLLEEARVELVSVTSSQAVLARQAYRDFGKGSGSKARLNFGDCFAYALAAENRDVLLFKGDDFSFTDVLKADLPEV